MNIPVRAAVLEARSLAGALQDASKVHPTGPILVSGMLAEQLARELAAGSEPGAVIVGDASGLRGAAVVVHVIAGEPSPADDELVRDADHHGVPVVLVQLWPQADWTRPFVLTPFIVECRTGEGFPISKIARRIVEATEHATQLAARAPVLRDAVARAVVGTAAIRAAVLGVLGMGEGRTRPLLALEQVRMLVDLRAFADAPTRSGALPALAAPAAATVGAGFLLREAARQGRRVVPAPIVNAAVAAVGTLALGVAFRRYADRLS
jgi:hypothetical protein